jgi:membrane protease subunit HflC
VRVPFIDTVQLIDKRILSVSMEDQQVLSTDQLRLQVDAYARFRVVDPLRMYISARTEERVIDALKPIWPRHCATSSDGASLRPCSVRSAGR